ncbi:MAG TPA: HAMP domain-containing sensor histidine kinase [Actinomycetota bacterium]
MDVRPTWWHRRRMVVRGGHLARVADVFVPSWISGQPFAALVRLGYGIRVLVGAAALAFTWALPATAGQRALHALLVGLVYLPWSFALLLAARRTEGPALRLASLAGDLLVVFMFQATIPAVHVAGMLGFVILTSYYSLLGGRRAGLPVAGAAVGLTALAQAITGQGVPSYILLMFGAVLACQVALLESVSHQQRAAAVRLRELDRLKDEFLASISHELRTPLTSIDGFSRTLLRKWELLDEAERLEFVELISTNSQDLTYLIEQLLDHTRLEAERLRLQPQPVDLVAAVVGCVEAVDPAIGARRVKVEIDVGTGVSADPNALRRILSNLLLNAARFSPHDAPITVGAGRRHGATVVWVRDEGAGVPPADRTRIFDAFYQGRRERKQATGTGVGLAVARRYVEAHGGRIWVESTPGGGATFLFTLPAARGQSS